MNPNSERDRLEFLWRVLGRVVEMTTGEGHWNQMFAVGNFDEDNEADYAGNPLWESPLHHRYRLLMIHHWRLSRKHFKPSPKEWLSKMHGAADGLARLHEQHKEPSAIPPHDSLVHRLTLSKGMRDVWRALDELTANELIDQLQKKTPQAASSPPTPLKKESPRKPPPPKKKNPATKKRGRKRRKETSDSGDDKPQPQKCRECGEWIRRPVARAGNVFICTDCAGEHYVPIGAGGGNCGEASDRQYHGGMFYRGEW